MYKRVANVTIRLLVTTISVALLLLTARNADPVTAGTPDPCDIVTPGEVLSALGEPLEYGPDGGTFPLGARYCGWGTENADLGIVLYSGLDEEADILFNNWNEPYEQEVDGIGDRARWLKDFEGPWERLSVRIDHHYVSVRIVKQEPDSVVKVDMEGVILQMMFTILDRLVPRSSVEFTQAIQELQDYYSLQVSIASTGGPPVPIIAGKPAVVRVYYDEVQDFEIRTVHLSDVASAEATMHAIPGCTVEEQRRQENGCESADLYFTPPEGEWTARITIRDEDGGQIDEMEFEITSVDTPEFGVTYLPICVALTPGATPTCPSSYIEGPAPNLMRKLFPVAPDEFFYNRMQVPAIHLDGLVTGNSGEQDLLADLRLRWELLSIGSSFTGFSGSQLAGWLPAGGVAPDAQGDITLGISDPVWGGSTGRVSWQIDTSATTPLDAEFTLAHEIGHNLGLLHTNKPDGCGAGDNATDWPYNDSTIQEVGFDVEAKEVRVDSVSPPSPLKLSVMSYCSPPGSNIWISPFTFRKLAEGGFTPQASLAAPAGIGQVLIVKGVVQADGSAATIDSAYVIESATPAPASNPLGNHCIHLSGGANIEHCFVLRFQNHRTLQPMDEESFTLRVPFPPGTNKIGLMRGNLLLTELEQTPSSPSIQINEPQPGTEWSGQQTIAWLATDPDGGTPNVALLYSPDGTNWLPLDVDNTEGQFTFDTGDLEGDDISIRLIASDGVNTTETTVDGIALSNTAGLTWGDLNCSGGVDPVDALLTLRDDAGLSTNTGACPAIGDPIAAADNVAWGDIDCSGTVDPVDSLKLLRNNAGLSAAKPEGCPELASLI